MSNNILPPLPSSWSALTWRQLCDVWTVKMRYGGNPDVAAAAALLVLCRLTPVASPMNIDPMTGEQLYLLVDGDGRQYIVSPRLFSHIARQALPWLAFPYGDQGEREERDEQGYVKERREGHQGYVNQNGDWRDAIDISEETVEVGGYVFALPQVALNNLTWHQYRALQAIVPQIFDEATPEQEAIDLKARFLAYSMVPELQDPQSADTFRPAHRFTYNADRAEQTVPFWRQQIEQGTPLFHICFQVYQTAMQNYYPSVYPLLFGDSSPSDPLHTALSGEVDTINAVMKYQGYTEQQQVYDANLPIVFGVLNTMTKEAKDIEKMNRSVKRKH